MANRYIIVELHWPYRSFHKSGHHFAGLLLIHS